MKSAPSSKALNYAYRLLSVRRRSEREIKIRLEDKGYGSKCISEVIEHLKEKRLLDDTRFAQDWIRSRITFSPKGVFAIKDELLRKGVEEGIIDSAFKDTQIGYNEYEVAKTLVSKRIENLKGLSKIRRKKSIYDYLARRGFSFDIINDIIKEYDI